MHFFKHFSARLGAKREKIYEKNVFSQAECSKMISQNTKIKLRNAKIHVQKVTRFAKDALSADFEEFFVKSLEKFGQIDFQISQF